jgi:hypothetical protein
MMCHQLGLGLGNLWKSCDEYLRNALMVLLARAPQERLIGGILDQGMLEDIRGLGWQPLLVEELRCHQLLEPLP